MGAVAFVTCEYLPSVTKAKSYRVLLNAAVTKRRDVSVQVGDHRIEQITELNILKTLADPLGDVMKLRSEIPSAIETSSTAPR